MTQDPEFLARVNEFLDNVELVLDVDWEYSRIAIDDGLFDNTLLDSQSKNPVCFKGSNWMNRSSLQHSYRELRSYMLSEGIRRTPPWQDGGVNR